MIQWLNDLFDSAPENLTALIVSGAGGAFVRSVFAPEADWKRRLIEGLAGALSAIFLGGVVGHVIDLATGSGVYAYLAGGFIMGEGGIAAVHAFRRKVLPAEQKDRKDA